jgi:hypothetical protein
MWKNGALAVVISGASLASAGCGDAGRGLAHSQSSLHIGGDVQVGVGLDAHASSSDAGGTTFTRLPDSGRRILYSRVIPEDVDPLLVACSTPDGDANEVWLLYPGSRNSSYGDYSRPWPDHYRASRSAVTVPRVRALITLHPRNARGEMAPLEPGDAWGLSEVVAPWSCAPPALAQLGVCHYAGDFLERTITLEPFPGCPTSTATGP